jgi:hypothetical protein
MSCVPSHLLQGAKILVGPHALRHTFATRFRTREKSKSYLTSYEPQESCENIGTCIRGAKSW